jgi:hypothetical protein
VQLGKRPQSSSKTTGNGGDPEAFSPPPATNRRDQTTKIVTIPTRGRLNRPTSEGELRDELSGMAASLQDVDPRSAERLQDLADSITSEAGRLRWADVDLRRAFNTEHLSFAYAERREGGFAPASIDYADKIRNVLVFLPIFLTWFALFEATRSYAHYIEKYPDQVRQPFLLLWQQGFGGESNGIFSATFATVAIIDAMLIALVIALTFYVHGRRESREDAINGTAQTFQRELDNVLAEATVALAPDRAGRPAMLARSVERLAERFEANSQELLTRLQVEHDRLDAISARREKEFADFGVFASGMRAGAEETHRLLLDMRQVSTGLSQALEDLTSEVAVSADQQRSLFTAVSSLERLVATGIQSDHGVTRQLAEAAQTLADAADKSLAGAEAAAQAGRVASEAVHGIAEISQGLIKSQTRVEAAIAGESDANTRLAEALRGGMSGVNASAKSLGEIQTALGQLKQEFTRISDLSQDHAHALSRMMTEQSAISSSLSQAARDLSGGGRNRETNEEFSTLIRRLDGIATQLGRTVGAPPVEPAASSVRSMLPNSPDLLAEPAESQSGRGRGLWPRREP